MERFQLYQDIQMRTGGEIYIGVAGPVRTGKSTFIKSFMQTMVIPHMTHEHQKTLAMDELPQSSNGRTIMTTEPKFVPREAALLNLSPQCSLKVRLVDCVGFLVPGAVGLEEDGKERLVHTPWFPQEIPISKAAEVGTRKVIRDHSTVGILITTDGSFSEISREAYLSAEEQAVEECKAMGKPFLMLLNSAVPNQTPTVELAAFLSERYAIPVLPVNCEKLEEEDFIKILTTLLGEFPATTLQFHFPAWFCLLPPTHPLKAQLCQEIHNLLSAAHTMNQLPGQVLADHPFVLSGHCQQMDYSTGCVDYEISLKDEAFFQMISAAAGITVEDYGPLLQTLYNLSRQKDTFDRVRTAMEQVQDRGYGVVIPQRAQIHLKDPELVRKGNRYGVRMMADAPSIHMIQAMVRTEISPIVGSREQADDLMNFIRSRLSEEGDTIWETSIFGKPIGQIVEDGIEDRIDSLTDDTQQKLRSALQKIVNNGSGNLICILLS